MAWITQYTWLFDERDPIAIAEALDRSRNNVPNDGFEAGTSISMNALTPIADMLRELAHLRIDNEFSASEIRNLSEEINQMKKYFKSLQAA